MRTTAWALLVVAGTACGPAPMPNVPPADSGTGDGGAIGDGGMQTDGGGAGVDAGWGFVSIAGSKCALGAQAGLGYSAGSADVLLLFVQGGGACWNNGTCHPSVHQWGPICNYGQNSVCFADVEGGTKPLAVNVSHPNPYPADGGGVFPSELSVVTQSVLFNRRAENPLRDATYVYVPYCTGDLHAGAATRTYQYRADAFGQTVTRTHHFAGAANMDAYLAWLRAKHPSVKTVFLTGVSGGGYGAQLNFARVRAAFPEATVHLLADSAPMVQPAHFAAWTSEWNLSLPDGGFPGVVIQGAAAAPGSRVALLSFQEDAVLTRFFYSSGDTSSWANPPFGTYTANLVSLEAQYDATVNARYFRLPGQDHVMLQRYGVVQSDGGISAPGKSRDGGTDLKRWLDAWISGDGGWDSHR
jgi:hypothetical protein